MPQSSFSSNIISLMIQMKNSHHTWEEIGNLLNLSPNQARAAVKIAYPTMKFPHGRSKAEKERVAQKLLEERKKPEKETEENKDSPVLVSFSWIKPPTKEQLMAGNARIAKVED